MTVSANGKQVNRSKAEGTRVSTILDVRGAGKKSAKTTKKRSKVAAKSSKGKKEGTRVSTILEVRAAGKKRAAAGRANTARDGSKS